MNIFYQGEVSANVRGLSAAVSVQSSLLKSLKSLGTASRWERNLPAAASLKSAGFTDRLRNRMRLLPPRIFHDLKHGSAKETVIVCWMDAYTET